MNYCCKSQTIRALYATLIHTADPNSFRRLGRRPCMRPQETRTKKSCAGKPQRENGGTRSVSPQPAARTRRQRANQRGVAVIVVLVHAAPHLVQPGTFNGQRSNPATQPPLAKNNSILRRACARVSAPRPHAHVTLTCSVLPLPATYIAPPLPIFAITHTNTLPSQQSAQGLPSAGSTASLAAHGFVYY